MHFFGTFLIVPLVRVAAEVYGKHTMKLGRRTMKKNTDGAQGVAGLDLRRSYADAL